MDNHDLLQTLKKELGEIENTMCDRWVAIVRQLWGVRNPQAEASFCPDVTIKDEVLQSPLAGEVHYLRIKPPQPINAALIYAHGGGWISPLNQDHVKWAKYIAHLTGFTVFAVEYKLAPEYPFPAALHDMIAIYKLALQEKFTKICVGGDSSGGNLSVALALYALDHSLPLPHKILDNCSFHDFYFEQYESAQTIGLAKNSSIDMRLVGFNRGCYVPYLKDWKHPYASPIYADLTALPDIFILVAGDDPLCDDNIAFAAAAKKSSKKEVFLKIYPNMPHSFHCHIENAPEMAYAANADLAEFLLK